MSDTSLDEESVYSVRYRVSDTVRPDPNTARPVTDNKVNNSDGPRIQQTLSEPIEVQIDESNPENAEEEAAYQILKRIGDEYIMSITDTEDIDEEGALDVKEMTLEGEEELIKTKSKFEQTFIRQYRSVFSESLSPSKHLKTEPMKIMLASIRDEWNNRLYCYKPRPIPYNIRHKARDLINKLLSQGIIRRVNADEPAKYCAPCQFVPKKSGKLRFVVDFTALNKYVIRPVHSISSSEQVMNSIKPNTTHVAIIDFVNGYFQSQLAKESQLFTTFICEFGRFCFTRSPQGLSSSGDHFCQVTDEFFSGLGDFLTKQVDDLLLQGTSEENLKQNLHTTLKDARKTGCIFSISKFQIGTQVVTSGFQITTDPTGKTTPKLGPDPARVEKLTNMQKPKDQTGVRSLLGLLTQLSKFCPDYAQCAPALRALTHKNAKFTWTSTHQEEFDKIISKFGNLEYLRPYDPNNQLLCLTDASYLGLGFILFQQDKNGKFSIVMVGSTSLKDAQCRWYPM